MGEVAVQVLKILVRIGIILTMSMMAVSLVILAYSGIQAVLNAGALGDIFAFIQMWLPFDLNVMMTFLVTASIIYMTYLLAQFTYGMIERFIR